MKLTLPKESSASIDRVSRCDRRRTHEKEKEPQNGK